METDPRVRRTPDAARGHEVVESAGDIDGLLATLSTTCTITRTGAPIRSTSSQATGGVRAFYERFIASGAGRLQLDIDRLIATATPSSRRA